MNYWTQISVEFANQRNYLDSLFRVYPMSPNLRREISWDKWSRIKTSFERRNNDDLVRNLLYLDLFPIKDSYVAYLKRDPSSIERNPETINRLAGNLYEMGLDSIFEKCTEPKETNRQIGPLFKRWIESGVLGLPIYHNAIDFLSTEENAVLNISDLEMKKFAEEYLGYNHSKGLDFIARCNNKYVIGEAKFITDFGGHQDRQFEDAISTITLPLLPNRLNVEVIKIAICDGVLYINSGNKMHKHLIENDEQIILSSLVLREFLYSI
ncbi:MAG: hypothetical protein ACI3XL_00945 [Eubacteriales bacterium]